MVNTINKRIQHTPYLRRLSDSGAAMELETLTSSFRELEWRRYICVFLLLSEHVITGSSSVPVFFQKLHSFIYKCHFFSFSFSYAFNILLVSSLRSGLAAEEFAS